MTESVTTAVSENEHPGEIVQVAPLSTPLASMTEEEGRALFMEIVAAHEKTGRTVTPEICQGLLRCLGAGQYFVHRNCRGELVAAGIYWWVRSENLGDVVNGTVPPDISSGHLVWLAGGFNRGGQRGAERMLKALRGLGGGRHAVAYRAKVEEIRFLLPLAQKGGR
jgi:hypothetical protein